MTHALFLLLDASPSFKRVITEGGYHLIIDKAIEVVSPVEISKADTQMLFDTGKMAVDDNGWVEWHDHDYKGKFSDIKNGAQNRSLLWFKNTILLWILPPDLLKAFEHITVLTFMFEGSLMAPYLRMHGMPYQISHLENRELIPGEQELHVEKEKLRG
jgi:hypothetical protein